MYQRLMRPLLFQLDAERAHDLSIAACEWLGRSPALCAGLRRLVAFDHPMLRTQVAGIEFANPLGLAAGYDKNGRAIRALGALGFGHVEIGSVSGWPSAQIFNEMSKELVRVTSPHETLNNLPIILFETPADWQAWLDANHTTSKGLWLRLAKKGSGLRSLTYDEALEVALCYGWIDGQKKTYNDTSWLQKFTPRGPKSIWSKINVGKAERLIESGKMQPAGLKQVENAKADGRWEAAYDGQRIITTPEDLQAALDQNAAAQAFFATLNSTNRYALLFRIHTAKKPETRAKRIQEFIGMLERGEKLYP